MMYNNIIKSDRSDKMQTNKQLAEKINKRITSLVNAVGGGSKAVSDIQLTLQYNYRGQLKTRHKDGYAYNVIDVSKVDNKSISQPLQLKRAWSKMTESRVGQTRFTEKSEVTRLTKLWDKMQQYVTDADRQEFNIPDARYHKRKGKLTKRMAKIVALLEQQFIAERTDAYTYFYEHYGNGVINDEMLGIVDMFVDDPLAKSGGDKIREGKSFEITRNEYEHIRMWYKANIVVLGQSSGMKPKTFDDTDVHDISELKKKNLRGRQ